MGSVGGGGLQLEAKARVVEDELTTELFVASRESSVGGREGKLEPGLRALPLLRGVGRLDISLSTPPLLSTANMSMAIWNLKQL